MAHRYLRCCVRRKQDMAVRCTDAENSIIKSIFPDHGRKETSIFQTALHKHRQNSGYPVVLLYVAQMAESPESLRTSSEASGNSDLDFHTRDLPENHIHNKRGHRQVLFLIQAYHLVWENHVFPCWQQPEASDKRHWNAPGAHKAGDQPPAQLSGTDLAQSDRDLQNLSHPAGSLSHRRPVPVDSQRQSPENPQM